jgi:excisionase family DNA binding protein
METLETEKTVLLAQPEAARLLGVERTTIWRMCRRGDLTLVHIGRRALVTRASIDAFVNSQVQRL